jgi:hypothetical protein
MLLLPSSEREGKRESQTSDSYVSSCSEKTGILEFKSNKSYLKWKTPCFSLECLWWRAALVGFLPSSEQLVCAFSHSLALVTFCRFYHTPNTGLVVSFGFSRVVFTSQAERPLFQPTFWKQIGVFVCGFLALPLDGVSLPVCSLYLFDQSHKTCTPPPPFPCSKETEVL